MTKATRKAIKNLFVGLILFIVSIILKYPLMLLSLIYTVAFYICSFSWVTGLNQLGEWFKQMALSNDQTGNVQNAELFDMFLIEHDGHKFGDEDDTISYVLARNEKKETLTGLGRFISRLLNWIEKDHLTKSLWNKVDKDEEAALRLESNKYFEK